MKQRTTISVEKDTVAKMKQLGINISQFCEEAMLDFIKYSEAESTADEILKIEEEKRKLDLQLYRIHKLQLAKLDIKDYDSQKYAQTWNNFLNQFEDWYYGIVDLDTSEVIRITGLQEPQLKKLGLFIIEYVDDDIDSIRNNIDYAIMRYNEVNLQPIARSGGKEW